MTDETATALEHEATGCGVALCWWVDARTRGVGCLRVVFLKSGKRPEVAGRRPIQIAAIRAGRYALRLRST